MESGLMANAVTEAAFNTNIKEFLTGVTEKGYRPGSDGSAVITLPELLGAGPGGIGGNYSGDLNFGKVLQSNLKDNGAKLLMSLIVIPAAFRIGSRLLKKPRAQANRMLRMSGLEVKV